MSEESSGDIELAEIPGSAWTTLVRATKDRRHAFRTPVLCTTDAEDGTPRVRTVVLRQADPGALVLGCHTDRRAPKLDDIRRQPMVAWIFYDAKARVQLRVRALAEVHVEGEEFERAWSRTALMSRRCYLAPHEPGTRSDEPSANLPEDVLRSEPDAQRSEDGRANFALVRTRVLELDWLWLHHGGHRRAQFRWDAEGGLALSDWLHP